LLATVNPYLNIAVIQIHGFVLEVS